jgi:hypothetical protein
MPVFLNSRSPQKQRPQQFAAFACYWIGRESGSSATMTGIVTQCASCAAVPEKVEETEFHGRALWIAYAIAVKPRIAALRHG